LHKSTDGQAPPFPQTDLFHSFRDRNAKGGVTVQNCNAHLDLRDLAVEVPCYQALAEWFRAMYLGFDAAPSVVAAPVPLD
jgi:hypothetical protein